MTAIPTVQIPNPAAPQELIRVNFDDPRALAYAASQGPKSPAGKPSPGGGGEKSVGGPQGPQVKRGRGRPPIGK